MNDNIFNRNLRVTFYARVSTDNISQESSIVNQEEYFINYICSNRNWIYVPGYVDYGISGKSVRKRSSFLRMIHDGVSGNFDFILTKSVSRFARNTIDSIRYTDLLKRNNVGVYFINDNINTLSSDSEFRLTLMASIAQDEIRKLSESVRFGLSESIKRGVVLGSSNILGYRKNCGKLVIVEKEASIVRDVFCLFSLEVLNYREVADIVNRKYNKKFDSTSVRRILTNYKYKGYYCGRKSSVIDYKCNKRISIDRDKLIIYKDNYRVPPIVSNSLWNRVNDIISKKKIISNNMNVFCGIHKRKCRYIRKRYRDRYYNYYYCKNCFLIRCDLLDIMCKNYKINKIDIYKYSYFTKIVVFINKY
jgi:DNA invertase Pin-like site-specific DNA recombinase